MAQRNLPTASVRDPRGSIDESDHTPRSDPPRSTAARSCSSRERIDALEREVDALEAELERRDERLQSVIDRYEAVIANQRREYEARLKDDDARRGTTTLRNRLSELLRGD